jgi:O-antigen ligase
MVQDNRVLLSLVSKLLLILGPLASILVSPSINYDPINPIKLLVLTTFAFCLFFIFLMIYKKNIVKVSRLFWLIIILFVSSLVLAFLFSGAPINQQIWGTFGRNTGILAYFSLVIILVVTVLMHSRSFYNGIIKSFLITSVFMTLYCGMQAINIDPINWNNKLLFGTFGNVNFLSAFLGISSIIASSLILSNIIKTRIKLILLILIFLDLLIIFETKSIQGFIIFLFGVSIVMFIWLKKEIKNKYFIYIFSLIVLIGTSLTVFGLLNKGPLSKILHSDTLIYRTDYWQAGWKMTMQHPLFGVGLDSYGDWYRSMRGSISANRSDPERVSNTAHNVFLDLSSTGGVMLALSYILIILFAFKSGFSYLKRQNSFDAYFVSIFAGWIGYLIFSLASINNLGISVWGWMLTGAVIGYELVSKDSILKLDINSKKYLKTRQSFHLSSTKKVISFGALGAVVGFAIAIIPLNADAKFKSAISSSNLSTMIESTEILGSTSYHKQVILEFTLKNGFQSESKLLSESLIKNYPREILGWRALYFLEKNDSIEKENALSMIINLDPFNLTYSKK